MVTVTPVTLMLREPQSKDGNARFTMEPLKPLYDQWCGRYRCFSRLLDLKVFNSDNFLTYPALEMCVTIENNQFTKL